MNPAGQSSAARTPRAASPGERATPGPAPGHPRGLPPALAEGAVVEVFTGPAPEGPLGRATAGLDAPLVKPGGWVAASAYARGGYYDWPTVRFWRGLFQSLWPVFGPTPSTASRQPISPPTRRSRCTGGSVTQGWLGSSPVIGVPPRFTACADEDEHRWPVRMPDGLRGSATMRQVPMVDGLECAEWPLAGRPSSNSEVGLVTLLMGLSTTARREIARGQGDQQHLARVRTPSAPSARRRPCSRARRPRGHPVVF